MAPKASIYHFIRYIPFRIITGSLPECVNFFDLVEGVLAKLDVMRCFAAALILVGGDVRPEGLQVAQAVTCNGNVSTLSLNQLQ